MREGTEEEPLLDEERGHYLIDEKNRSVELTDDGYVLVEELLEESEMLGDSEGLYSVSNLQIMKFVQATLRAHFLFQKNVHYLVRNNEVLLIDEHTGRTMPGRRMSEGVHQALECKENVPIQRESQTLASTTFQNFFRLFKNLSGMTGTADTEAVEFNQIYGLDVIIIPTNVPMIRNDHNDLVFLTKKAKYKALVDEIESLRNKSAPILVGTVSVESSEEVSEFLKVKKIPHQILNAKHHEKEAEVIANAGKPGMVTIATNMAGRGTDIVLGGKKEDQDKDEWVKNNETVLKSGGLHILGTERHESRRIDNQLRGRSGRQGDIGESIFFLSLEDDLVIVTKDNPNPALKNLLRMEFLQNEYYVNVYNYHSYLYNVLDNDLVPEHIIISAEAKKELAEEYNIVKESQWPEISRFDPAALAIGLRPGQVTEIIRKSPTALETKYYRLCVSGGLK